MFKGQGANQALEDGPLLASWLCRTDCSSILSREVLFTRIRCFEREMVDRVKSKVLQSRDAAQLYHSPMALCHRYNIQGIKSDAHNDTALKLMKERNVNALLNELLLPSVLHIKNEIESNQIEDM